MIKILVVASTTFLFASTVAHAKASFAMSQLGFMSGCWVNEDSDAGSRYEERFTKPTENMMLGVAQLVRAGSTEFYELLPVIKRADKIVYVPYINGDKSVEFTLTLANDQSAMFENPDHDFPQKIIYTRAQDTLTARIEGNQNGQAASEEFVMNRVTCNE